MHQINCPWCGVRDEAEFQYQGDATKERPKVTKTADPQKLQDAFFDYTYVRDNPKGWHTEWWHHIAGCRQYVKVVRNTLTHQISATGFSQDQLKVPTE